MEEIIYRKYSRLQKEDERKPDLIIVDGGQLQLKATQRALDALSLSIPVIGLFKNEKHQTKGIITLDGEIIDLTGTPSLFFFLIRVQDEVHRFAITFHKQLRSKAMSRSIFDGIAGLGPSRQALLNQRYASIDMLKKASLEELMQLIPKSIAEILYQKLANLKS
jgi:excinuclease ABC subunit C